MPPHGARGATLNAEPISVSSRPMCRRHGACHAAQCPPQSLEGWRAAARTRNHRPSIAYRLALVAEGRFDVMLTFRETWEWDIAAGDPGAGGRGHVTDASGAPIRFNRTADGARHRGGAGHPCTVRCCATGSAPEPAVDARRPCATGGDPVGGPTDPPTRSPSRSPASRARGQAGLNERSWVTHRSRGNGIARRFLTLLLASEPLTK
jgi:hypothetical protein